MVSAVRAGRGRLMSHRGETAVKAMFRLVTAAITIAGLWLAYLYGPHNAIPDPLTRNVNFFSFFTIQTNILVALAMLLPAVAPGSWLARFFDSPAVRIAIANYIIIVGVVYHALLAHLWDPEGLNLLSLIILHYGTPVAFVADWLLFNAKGKTRWFATLTALAYPAAYAVWTLARGAVTGWYPYPFIDVVEQGYAVVLANMAGLALAFLALGLLLNAIDKWLAVQARKSANA